jgi:energy-coupling factor transport system ATP-binding protein
MAPHDLQLEQVTYYYPDAPRPALDRINWTVGRGEFVLLVGPSGCGKSTLLRTLNGLVPEFYGGKVGGTVRYRGKLLTEFSNRRIARHVGMVFQDPEKQLVMTEVEREIAFGLENLQVPEAEMRRRVAEVMSFFDLTGLRGKHTADLSGGEKQKVAIASVMALQPDVLLLDEPTSQLDPGAAQEILDLVKGLNEELGITVVLVEQRLDRVLHLADRIVAMHEGRIEYDGVPSGFAHYSAEQRRELLPPVTKLFVEAERTERPLTVKEARQLVWAQYANLAHADDDVADEASGGLSSRFMKKVKRLFAGQNGGQRTVASEKTVLEAKHVRYAYPEAEDVLQGIDFAVEKGTFTSLLGANGTGKSTLLRHFVALLQPSEGKVLLEGRDLAKTEAADLAGTIGYLSQHPGDYLFHETLWQECEFSRQLIGLTVGDEVGDRAIAEVLESLDILQHRDRNPRDLSGGERQRAALATVLVQQPKVLLLDEPTRGLDTGQKEQLGRWLQQYVSDGGTVLMITHDIEFAAEHSQKVALLDDGVIVAQGSPQEMLARGLFYATQVGRAFRGIDSSVVTIEEGVRVLQALQERAEEAREL